MSWTACLSGPERTRAKAELALETARIPVLPSDHHALMNWESKLASYPSGDKPPKGVKAEPQAFLTVEHADVNEAAGAVAKAGWTLRVHFETPDEPPRPEPDPVMATLAELRAEINVLKARVG